jgi:anti-sigma regulatory factor (Ser/Thr protein kinase)
MVPMSGGEVAALPEGLLDGGVWFRVEAAGTASAVRRAAERLATELGMTDPRRADLAIVAAEVAGNLVKHADEGAVLVRPVRADGQAGVELLAVDSGPGMTDVAHAVGDGHSTAGTLGIGLGAIVRQASWCDLYSVPGQGTVLAVQVWTGTAPAPTWAAGLTRPITGETISGDGYAARTVGGRHQVLVCDGLGHGRLAAAATQEAMRVFEESPAGSPATVVEALHRALHHTRGAALAVAELDGDVVRYAGLGNIAGAVHSLDGSRRSMVSLPGIAGHQRRVVRDYEYPLPAGAVVIMHSDGVVDRWSSVAHPELLGHSAQVIAAAVLRDAGTRRDDACVLAARAP